MYGFETAIDNSQCIAFNYREMYLQSLLILTLVLTAVAHAEQPMVAPKPTALSIDKIPAGLVTLSEQSPLSKHAFVVDKSARTLFVYELNEGNIKLIANHPTDIGKKEGPKTRANDFRTPVGIYFLREQKTQPEIPFDLYGTLAFTTDYPNVFDKREAKTGNGIWLHAVPDTVPLTRGSRGCVVVRNNVIQSLSPWVSLGETPLLIYDKINFLTTQEHSQQKQAFLKQFENWRQAWESHDVDQYMQYYDETFRNDEMNYKQWYRHKKGLTQNYSFIKVALGQPLVLQNKDQVVLRFTQKYQSDKHTDYGEKTIHGRWVVGGSFKIIREEWKALPEKIIEISSESKPASNSN